MAFEIKMPQLSDTMHSGKILRWNKHEGDAVERGDILAEVETDKANLDIESFVKGTLLAISVPAGADTAVGEVIAYIGDPGEAVSIAGGQPAEAPPLEEAAAEEDQAPPAEEQPAAPRDESPEPRLKPKASPLARKIAAEHGIDLAAIQGSGPDGRIVREDVERVVQQGPRPAMSAPARRPAPAAAPAAAPVSLPAGVGGKLVPFSKMRASIARRMVESAAQSPHFFTTAAINMDAAKELRETLKRKPDFKGLSLNHMIIKAAAYALAREPRINNAARGDQIFVPDQINIGVVTAVEDGLLIPVIKSPDRLPLKEIVAEARAAVERAKSGKPNTADLSGGTFTISNMGMYDVENFTAIISPGQGAILSVSAIKEQAVVRDGRVVPGLTMRVTLSVDHRVIDGVMAAIYLGHLKEALETPALLLL